MPINIIVSTKDVSDDDIEKVNNGGSVAPENATKKLTNVSGKKTIGASVFANSIVNSLKSSATSMFNYSVANYGNFTGDYIGQARMQSTISATTGIIGMGASIGMGFATGGVVGGAIAITTSAISLTTQAIQQSITYNATITKANQKANFNSLRIGTILTDGNR